MNNILTVSQINRYISFKFKDDINLKNKLIKGEISNFTHHLKTGHFYFTLKDNESSIKAVMFADFAKAVKFRPENGMEIIAMANVQVFERDGVYQLYVYDMYPSGVGALYLAFEQLKEKLFKEGLFDAAHKLPLPKYPKKIGIITAKTGAALQDMLNIISRRYPVCEVLLMPAIVQGENAPASICQAIYSAMETDCDLLILGRGGGSFEDLSAFNSEQVARAAYECTIPLISAVGHETDVTIVDFVADLRAPTPSAAAELAVPDKNFIYGLLNGYLERLEKSMVNLINAKEKRLDSYALKFAALSPQGKFERACERLEDARGRLEKAILKIIAENKMAVEKNLEKLEALNPLNVLSRGYALVYAKERPVGSITNLSCGDEIKIKFSNGEAVAVIKEIKS